LSAACFHLFHLFLQVDENSLLAMLDAVRRFPVFLQYLGARNVGLEYPT